MTRARGREHPPRQRAGARTRCHVGRRDRGRRTAPLSTGAALLDAEKLDCYRLAAEFQALVGRLVPRRHQAALRDQLDRASVSTVLNIAEGAGRVSPADKARFYAMARGSASECAAIVDLLWARGQIDPVLRGRARSALVRIVQMLTRLGASMGRSTRTGGAKSSVLNASRT